MLSASPYETPERATTRHQQHHVIVQFIRSCSKDRQPRVRGVEGQSVIVRSNIEKRIARTGRRTFSRRSQSHHKWGSIAALYDHSQRERNHWCTGAKSCGHCSSPSQ